MENIFNGIYKNKTVFVTGHTGFKGAWLSIWLEALGAKVVGYSLNPKAEPSLFETIGLEKKIISVIGDVRFRDKLESLFNEYKPAVVFHLAAQPLVRRSYIEPVNTYETNVMGTLNILEAVRKTDSVRACLIITSDKCYENREWAFSYRENDPLGGFDPYSSSKACAELVTDSYRKSFFGSTETGFRKAAVSTARSGNVIGGGDWAADRIVPDIIRALTADRPVPVRNPGAVRPWQHVLEPLAGYLWLAALMFSDHKSYNAAWNFGPGASGNIKVRDIVDQAIKLWGCGAWTDLSEENKNAPHEANFLKLDCTRANNILGWYPVYNVSEAMEETVKWYLQYYKNNSANIYSYTLNQIKNYVKKAHQGKPAWCYKTI
ncbi:MAG: CDP-glucose 4,6-dehydratase [Dehalobacter sp.]|nr:CDP-glucose 4,6-dehydratase [Dehalobacter sp.]